MCEGVAVGFNKVVKCLVQRSPGSQNAPSCKLRVQTQRERGRKGRRVRCMVTLKCRPSVQQQRQRQPHRHHQLNEMIEAELKSLVSLQHARQQLASSPSPTDKLSMAGIGDGGRGVGQSSVWSLWSRSLITTCCKFLWKPLHDLHAQIAHTPH